MPPPNTAKLRRSVVTAFRLNGLSLSCDAMTYLLKALEIFSETEQEKWTETILDRVQRLTLTSSLISAEVITQAIKECGRGDEASKEDLLHIIDAFDVPKLSYDPDRKKFLPDAAMQRILADASEKPKIFRYRYSVILQRVMNHKLFTPTILGIGSTIGPKKYDLKTIEHVIGSATTREKSIVLGMIAQLKEGKFFLEDLTGSIEMDMSECVFQNGFYTECCFILAEGTYEAGVFRVITAGCPPPEDASSSRSYYGMTNFFGGPPISVNRERLEQQERTHEGFTFVVLSDVHLDNLQTLNKLRVLFEGYNSLYGGVFILMGNFLSDPAGKEKPVALRNAFKSLADIIVDYPSLMHSFTFVIIPGPLDPGFTSILPRPPFAEVITSYFKEKVPNSIFSTNPCRIKYCTKEIVILREDVMSKMIRRTIYYPKNESIPETFVKTIISQSHLCPLPLHSCPVYWSYDHSLSLYPLPDVVIIGDSGEAYNVTSEGCNFFNPGRFLSNFSFVTYNPLTNEVERSQVPADVE